MNADTLEKTEGTIQASNAKTGSKAPWIEVIMVSPDSRKVCFGAHGGRAFVELGEVDHNLNLKRLKSVNLGGSTAITHMDWT